MSGSNSTNSNWVVLKSAISSTISSVNMIIEATKKGFSQLMESRDSFGDIIHPCIAGLMSAFFILVILKTQRRLYRLAAMKEAVKKMDETAILNYYRNPDDDTIFV